MQKEQKPLTSNMELGPLVHDQDKREYPLTQMELSEQLKDELQEVLDQWEEIVQPWGIISALSYLIRDYNKAVDRDRKVKCPTIEGE